MYAHNNTLKTSMRCVCVLLLTAIMPLLVVGCSSAPDKSKKQALDNMKQEARYNELKAHIDEWKKLKPGVERLVRLEAELKYLIQELSKASQVQEQAPAAVETMQVNDVPAETAESKPEMSQAVATKPEQMQAKPQPQRSELNNEAVTTAPVVDEKPTQVGAKNMEQTRCSELANQAVGSIGLHLLSFKDYTNLESAWKNLQQRFPELLCGTYARTAQVNVKGEVFNSLRIGPYQNRAAANEACMGLKRSGQYCALSEFSGQPLKN